VKLTFKTIPAGSKRILSNPTSVFDGIKVRVLGQTPQGYYHVGILDGQPDKGTRNRSFVAFAHELQLSA